jgi:hypothetical protein
MGSASWIEAERYVVVVVIAVTSPPQQHRHHTHTEEGKVSDTICHTCLVAAGGDDWDVR